uniref:Uncharacterized protein n=1 Tax=Parascaris equorum TaxID=6256 RepID=A0A914RKK3_PAREQ
MAYVDKQDSKVGKELMVDFGSRQSKVLRVFTETLP